MPLLQFQSLCNVGQDKSPHCAVSKVVGKGRNVTLRSTGMRVSVCQCHYMLSSCLLEHSTEKRLIIC